MYYVFSGRILFTALAKGKGRVLLNVLCQICIVLVNFSYALNLKFQEGLH